MTHRGPFQPRPFCDSVIPNIPPVTHGHRGENTSFRSSLQKKISPTAQGYNLGAWISKTPCHRWTYKRTRVSCCCLPASDEAEHAPARWRGAHAGTPARPASAASQADASWSEGRRPACSCANPARWGAQDSCTQTEVTPEMCQIINVPTAACLLVEEIFAGCSSKRIS